MRTVIERMEDIANMTVDNFCEITGLRKLVGTYPKDSRVRVWTRNLEEQKVLEFAQYCEKKWGDGIIRKVVFTPVCMKNMKGETGATFLYCRMRIVFSEYKGKGFASLHTRFYGINDEEWIEHDIDGDISSEFSLDFTENNNNNEKWLISHFKSNIESFRKGRSELFTIEYGKDLERLYRENKLSTVES